VAEQGQPAWYINNSKRGSRVRHNGADRTTLGERLQM